MAGGKSVPIRLWASYIIDWVMLIIFGLIAYGFTYVHPNPHNFSLVDLSISYPHKPDTVPIWAAGIAAGIVPALIILAVCFFFVPGSHFGRGLSTSRKFRLKLWEVHAGLLGLAMSLATAVMFTQGLKLFGKPRPNCLARCLPDMTRLDATTTGHWAGKELGDSWALVDIGICSQTDQSVLFDGFQSWPSGHSSTSWSGLLYITLWLCAKFAVTLPYLPSSRTTAFPPSSPSHARNSSLPQASLQSAYKKSDTRFAAVDGPIRHRDEAAAPPVYMLLFIILPIGTATYICVSRYMDYAHHGFDIISGSVLGIVCAYVSFRWYHLPVGRGSGWAWGPRTAGRAFGVGIGRAGYVDEQASEGFRAFGGGEREREEVELGLIGRNSTNVTREGDVSHGVESSPHDQDTAYVHPR